MRRSVASSLLKSLRGAAPVACSAAVGGMLPTSSCSPNMHIESTSKRYNIIGKKHTPPGYRHASMKIPITPEFAEECESLAKTAYHTKNYWDAISLWDRVLMFKREVNGPVTKTCAETLTNIGRVFVDLKEYGAAENAYSEAAAIYMELDGEHSLTYAEALGLVAHVYTHLSFVDEAENAFKETIAIYRDHIYNHNAKSWLPDDTREPPPEPNKHPLSSVAHALDDCSMLFVKKGWESRAATFLEEALEIRRFLYGKHPKFRLMIPKTLSKLAEVKRVQGDATRAEMYINECIEMATSDMGRASPAVAASVSTKGTLLSQQRKFREAKRCFDEAATTYAMTLGKDHPLVGPELVRIARMHEFLEEFHESKKMYDRGIEMMVKAGGGDRPEVLEAKMFRSSLLCKIMKHAEAITEMKEIVRIRKERDADDPQLAFVYHKLADALAIKKEPEAEAYFLLAIEQFRSNHERGLTVTQTDRHKGDVNNQKLLMTDVLDDLGLYYVLFKHHDRAEHYLKEALDIRRELLGEENHPTIGYSYSNFAVLHLDKREFDQCMTFCQSALRVYETLGKRQNLQQADVLTTMGQCLLQQQKYDEALAAHEKALSIRRVAGETQDASVAESLHHIARVYIADKKYHKAHKNLMESQTLASKHPEATEALRQEIQVTMSQLPPIDEWGNESRALPA